MLSGGIPFLRTSFAMPERADTEVYRHFLPQQEKHINYRFCRYCWYGSEEDIPEDLGKFENPGRQLRGCVKAVDRRGHLSCSSMVKHVRSHGICCNEGPRLLDNPPAIDRDATREWVKAHVLEDMGTIKAVKHRGHMKWMRRRLPGTKIGGVKMARRLVKELHSTCKSVIKTKVKTAIEQKCRITIGTDARKSKGKRQRHYVVFLAWWLDLNFKRHRVCLACKELVPSEERCKDGKVRPTFDHLAYEKATKPVLAEYGLVPQQNTVAFAADHDGTLRLAIKSLGFVVLGCGCHALQLQPRHVLPPLKDKSKKKVPKKDEEQGTPDHDATEKTLGCEAIAPTAIEEQTEVTRCAPRARCALPRLSARCLR